MKKPVKLVLDLNDRIRALEADLANKETWAKDAVLKYGELVVERDSLKARVAELEGLFCSQCGSAFVGTHSCGPTHAIRAETILKSGGRESGVPKAGESAETPGGREGIGMAADQPAAANPPPESRNGRSRHAKTSANAETQECGT